MFHHLVTALDLPVPDGVSPPRLHDLRHSFAVGCLLRWYRDGLDPSTRLQPAVDLHGPRRPRLDRGLPDDHPGAAGRGQPAIRSLRRTGLAAGRAMTPTQPLGPAPALVLRRPPDHRQGPAPGLGAQLPRHDPAAAGLRRGRQGLQDHPPDTRRSDLRPGRRVPAPPRSRTAATTSAPATSDSPRCTPCSTTSPAREPEMLGVCQRVAAIPMKRAAPAETRFLERDEIERAAAPPAPRRADSRCGTEPCCCSSTTPAHGCKRSPTCASGTSTSANTRSCACTARATSGAPARSGSRPRDCYATCSTRPTHRRRRRHRCSPHTGSP